MVNNQFKGFTPAGQIVGTLGTSLSQILGGYLGAKLEQDKQRREFDANKKILQLRYPNMSEEELSQLSQVPANRLPQIIQGIGDAEFLKVMGGNGTMQQGQPSESNRLIQTLQPENIPEELLPQQGINQQIPEEITQDQEDFKDENTKVIANEADELTKMEDRLKAANLNPAQYTKIKEYIDNRRKILRDTILSDTKTQMDIIEAQRKARLDEEKTAFAREKFDREIIQADKANKIKELELESKNQDRLQKQYGESYKLLIDSKIDLIEDEAILNSMKNANNDPNVTFGSPSFNMMADFLRNKLGIDVSAMQTDTAQILTKQFADLFARLPKQLKGSGIRTEKVLVAMAKKFPNINQSYVARAAVIESNLLTNALNQKRIEIAEKLKEENDYKFIPGFHEKLEKKMIPYYKKYFKNIEDIPKKIQVNKNIQMKQRAQDRGKMGALVGGGLGILAGAAKGALAGAGGGPVGALLGGAAGLAGGGLLGGFGGSILGEQVANRGGQLIDILNSGQRTEPVAYGGGGGGTF